MDMKRFLTMWSTTISVNKVMLILIVGMVFSNLILSVSVFSKKEIVTIQPPVIRDKTSVGFDFASTSYLESWSLFMSQALGNVTPNSVRFVKNSVEPLLSPLVYQSVMNALEKQVDDIRTNHITLYFEPRRIIREKRTGKIFVNGQSVLETSSGIRKRMERTYEFIFEVVNYMPSLQHVDTYTGPPKTIEELAKIKQRQERK